MVTLNVIYPATEGTYFDRDYYRDHHLPLVRENWTPLGLRSLSAAFVESALGGGEAAYHCIATLEFESREAFDAAVGGPTAAAVFGDIPKFTDATAVGAVGVAA